MAVRSPQASKERTFHVYVLLKNLCIVVHEYIVRQCFSLSPVHNFFHQVSGSCFYKVAHINEENSQCQRQLLLETSFP